MSIYFDVHRCFEAFNQWSASLLYIMISFFQFMSVSNFNSFTCFVLPFSLPCKPSINHWNLNFKSARSVITLTWRSELNLGDLLLFLMYYVPILLMKLTWIFQQYRLKQWKFKLVSIYPALICFDQIVIFYLFIFFSFLCLVPSLVCTEMTSPWFPYFLKLFSCPPKALQSVVAPIMIYHIVKPVYLFS